MENSPESDASARPLYERVGRFVYGFHRAGGSLDVLRDTATAPDAPPELARRAGQLVHDFDRIAKTMATVDDAEIASVMRESAQLQALIAAWRSSE